MKRVRARSTIGLTVVVLAVLTTATVVLVNHSARYAVCTILSPAGGAVVGLSALVLLVVVRALRSQVEREAGRGRSAVQRRECPECGHEVHGAWRMCPYCGAMVKPDPASGGNEVSA